MNSLHRAIYQAYYHGTLPWRWCRNLASAAKGSAPLLVVYYHRVADDQATPWTISRRLFTRQVSWLARHFEMISLAETQNRLRRGVNHRPAVSITFDDGYADNCEYALPLLIERGVPVTYFVATDGVLNGIPFAHDRKLELNLAPNNLTQLRELVSAGLEIGAHTRTHADLGAIHDEDQLYDELVRARDELQAAIDRPVRYFAFPFGQRNNLNGAAFAMAREAGFEAVCSAYGGYNFPGDDPFHLHRFSSESTMLPLVNWATVDPRKVHTPRFDPSVKSREEVAAV